MNDSSRVLRDMFASSRSRRPSRPGAVRGFMLALLAVFFMVLMIGLASGVAMYRSVALSQARADVLRTQSGLMANLVHVNDAARSLSLREGPEGPALVLTETLDSGSYETRIYLYGGHVVQEYAIAGRPFYPAGAQPLLESATFSPVIDGTLVSVTCDQGTFDVALRSEQGGDA